MAQPTTQQQPGGTQPPAPRRRRPRTPAWLQRPPVVVCTVLLVVVVELAAYALLGWLWWLVANAALGIVAWCGILAWRRKGKGGLLDRILGALFPGRGGTASRTSSKTSRTGPAGGGKGGPLSRLLGGGRGKGVGGGSGSPGRGALGKLLGGRGKGAGRTAGAGGGGGRTGKGGPLGKLLGGRGTGGGGKGLKGGWGTGGSWWPFGGGRGKNAKSKSGKAGQPWWKTLWDQGRAGLDAAMDDDAERQRRRAERRAQAADGKRARSADGKPKPGRDGDKPASATSTRDQQAAFIQPPPAGRPKGDSMYTEGASLFRFGRNLPKVSEALSEHAAEVRRHEEQLAATVRGLQQLATQADSELPADKALVAEIESIKSKLGTLLSNPYSAKLARLAAEAEALPGKYRAAHADDEARLTGRRGGVDAEKRADVAAGQADT